MKAQEDRAFIRRFSIVIFGFVILTVAILFLAFGLTSDFEPDAIPSKGPLTQERVAPVGGVHLSEEGLAAAETQPEVPAQTDPQAQNSTPTAASDGSDSGIDGKQVYDTVCAACHTSGAANAPIPGTDDMAQRATQGMDVLLDHVINGFNVMPPKGGRLDLSDDQMRAAVEFMLE